MVTMDIALGIATIFLLALCAKIAKADIEFYKEFYSEDLTKQK